MLNALYSKIHRKGNAMNSTTTPRILTIKQLAELYKGTAVTEYAIRQWVKRGAFTVIRSGKKTLINASIFESFLTNGGAKPTEEPRGIQRIM